MPAPTYTVPTANSPTSTEEPKIITALSEIKSLLTAGLDGSNFDLTPSSTVNASILTDASVTAAKLATDAVTTAKILDEAVTLAKIEDLTAGNLIVGNSSNRPTSTNPSGAVDVTSAGAFSLKYDSKAQGSATTLNAATYTTIDSCTTTPAAGDWLFQGKVNITDSTSVIQAELEISEAGTQRDYSRWGALSAASVEYVELSVMAILTLNGSEAVSLRGRCTGTSGSPSTNFGKLIGLRLT